MRPRNFLPLLSLLLATSFAQEDNLDCPDTSLTSFLVTLIDHCYSNGLTYFEQLLAALSESDSGYALLESFYTSSSLTILAPTDKAFQAANINPPFASLTEDWMTGLVALHVLKGNWAHDSLPGSPLPAVASSQLGIGWWLNETGVSAADQAVVLQQADGGCVSVRMAQDNATSWSSPIDLSGTSLSNLVVLPINAVSQVSRLPSHHSADDKLGSFLWQVISFPPKLPTALTLATSKQSVHGINSLPSAVSNLSSSGLQTLSNLTSGGFTLFAPIDEAFTPAVMAELSDQTSAAYILANHVSTVFGHQFPVDLLVSSIPTTPFSHPSGRDRALSTA